MKNPSYRDAAGKIKSPRDKLIDELSVNRKRRILFQLYTLWQGLKPGFLMLLLMFEAQLLLDLGKWLLAEPQTAMFVMEVVSFLSFGLFITIAIFIAMFVTFSILDERKGTPLNDRFHVLPSIEKPIELFVHKIYNLHRSLKQDYQTYMNDKIEL